MLDIRVETLQTLLRKAGHCVALDGVYGGQTAQASQSLAASMQIAGAVTAPNVDYRTHVWVDESFWVALKRAAEGRHDACSLRTSATGRSPVELDTGSPRRLVWPWVAAGAGVLLLGGIFLATRKRRRRRR